LNFAKIISGLACLVLLGKGMQCHVDMLLII
jgi:hypothetical protein